MYLGPEVAPEPAKAPIVAAIERQRPQWLDVAFGRSLASGHHRCILGSTGFPYSEVWCEPR
jgi:hypothetical protein